MNISEMRQQLRKQLWPKFISSTSIVGATHGKRGSRRADRSWKASAHAHVKSTLKSKLNQLNYGRLTKSKDLRERRVSRS